MKIEAREFVEKVESVLPSQVVYPFKTPILDTGYEPESLFFRAEVLAAVLCVCDLVVLLVAGIVSHRAGFGLGLPNLNGQFLLFCICIVMVISLQITGSYRLNAHLPPLRFRGEQVTKLLLGGACTLVFSLIAGMFIGAIGALSQKWVLLMILYTAIFLLLNRLAIGIVIQQAITRGYVLERVVLVGANQQTKKVLSTLLDTKHLGLHLLGVFEDRIERELPILQIPILGTTDDLIGFIRTNRVDRAIVTLPWVNSERIDILLQKLRTVPVRIDLVPNDLIWRFPCSDIDRIGPVPLLTFANGRIVQQRGITKRVEDLTISLFLAIVASPLLLLIALAIKLDSKGPVLFKQNRHGFNNQVFSVFKFRSMHIHQVDAGEILQATRHDPRVTRVGRFLRRSSLDELPQLINVIIGNMSIVGPRPHAVQHNLRYGSIISAYFARHNVKPGITGWAQVNGLRGETDTDEKMRLRVEHDLYYIENWSLFSDLKIILMTAIAVWFQKSAY